MSKCFMAAGNVTCHRPRQLRFVSFRFLSYIKKRTYPPICDFTWLGITRDVWMIGLAISCNNAEMVSLFLFFFPFFYLAEMWAETKCAISLIFAKGNLLNYDHLFGPESARKERRVAFINWLLFLFFYFSSLLSLFSLSICTCFLYFVSFIFFFFANDKTI